MIQQKIKKIQQKKRGALRQWCGRGVDGTALPARGAVLRGVAESEVEIREVSFGFGAAALACYSVVGTSGLFGSFVIAEKDRFFLARFADHSCEHSPGPLSHASISDRLGFRVLVNGSGRFTRIH